LLPSAPWAVGARQGACGVEGLWTGVGTLAGVDGVVTGRSGGTEVIGTPGQSPAPSVTAAAAGVTGTVDTAAPLWS